MLIEVKNQLDNNDSQGFSLEKFQTSLAPHPTPH